MLKLDPRGREASPRVHGKRPGKDVNKHILAYVVCIRASLVAQLLMNPPAMQRPAFDPSIRKIPWRRERQPTPVLLPGKSHEWRSLVGNSSWRRKESDMTERLHFHFLSKVKNIYLCPWKI